MRNFSLHTDSPHSRCFLRLAFLLAFGAFLVVAGCRKTVRTEDPQLQPIQQLLDDQLPAAASEGTVKAFLVQRGYVVVPSQRPGTVVAQIPDPDNREAPARVTFYFDANGKLNTFALARASGEDPKQ
jgi:hypothetical protein